MDSAYGSDKKPEFDEHPAAVAGSNLVRTFSKMSSDDISLSSCSDLSSVSTIKRPDSVNYDSVIRYFISFSFLFKYQIYLINI